MPLIIYVHVIGQFIILQIDTTSSYIPCKLDIIRREQSANDLSVCCTCAWQVHFEGGTVAQIVYSGDQTDRGQQQVVYTADGNSFTSVESGEHTLVYIHPADGTQVRIEFKIISKYGNI